MDFSTRGSQQSPAAPRPDNVFNGDNNAGRKQDNKASKRGPNSKWLKVGGVVLLAAVVVLLLAVIGTTVTSNNKSENSFVDQDKLQAVFLTNDQVYFGKITNLNGKFLSLSNIYYLQTQSSGTNQTTAASSNVSLVKLGCELHKPYDNMIINRGEVQFWENLQADGQVANAVKQYQQQNPNGQKCTNTATNGTSTGNVQGTPNTDSDTTKTNE